MRAGRTSLRASGLGPSHQTMSVLITSNLKTNLFRLRRNVSFQVSHSDLTSWRLYDQSFYLISVDTASRPTQTMFQQSHRQGKSSGRPSVDGGIALGYLTLTRGWRTLCRRIIMVTKASLQTIKCGRSTTQLSLELVSSQTTPTITYNEILYPLLYPRCGSLPPFRSRTSSVSSGSTRTELFPSHLHSGGTFYRAITGGELAHLQEGPAPSKPYDCPRRFLPFRCIVCFRGTPSPPEGIPGGLSNIVFRDIEEAKLWGSCWAKVRLKAENKKYYLVKFKYTPNPGLKTLALVLIFLPKKRISHSPQVHERGQSLEGIRGFLLQEGRCPLRYRRRSHLRRP